jgi:hypothetical protein
VNYLKKVLLILVILLVIILISFLFFLETATDQTLDDWVPTEKPLSLNISETFSYPLHENIITTVFWVGEEGSSDNNYIFNSQSCWDDKWAINSPENIFYFALPYNDFDNGERKFNVSQIVYWGEEKSLGEYESLLKNRWIEILYRNKTAYAQWEDCGPFLEDDGSYVFGNDAPKNSQLEKAGLDISPSTAEYLNFDGLGIVSWRFIDFSEVPDGPWRETVTISQIYWE